MTFSSYKTTNVFFECRFNLGGAVKLYFRSLNFDFVNFTLLFEQCKHYGRHTWQRNRNVGVCMAQFRKFDSLLTRLPFSIVFALGLQLAPSWEHILSVVSFYRHCYYVVVLEVPMHEMNAAVTCRFSISLKYLFWKYVSILKQVNTFSHNEWMKEFIRSCSKAGKST